jgi:membrane protein involved in colicin uptake
LVEDILTAQGWYALERARAQAERQHQAAQAAPRRAEHLATSAQDLQEQAARAAAAATEAQQRAEEAERDAEELAERLQVAEDAAATADQAHAAARAALQELEEGSDQPTAETPTAVGRIPDSIPNTCSIACCSSPWRLAQSARGVAPNRDEAAAAVSDALDELPRQKS